MRRSARAATPTGERAGLSVPADAVCVICARDAMRRECLAALTETTRSAASLSAPMAGCGLLGLIGGCRYIGLVRRSTTNCALVFPHVHMRMSRRRASYQPVIVRAPCAALVQLGSAAWEKGASHHAKPLRVASFDKLGLKAQSAACGAGAFGPVAVGRGDRGAG